jgi:TM2 domain-containing membrane protein YozV
VQYNVGFAYLLWLLSCFGALGFHRFYLGKVGTGFLWIFTGGLFGIGCLYDLATLPKQVREANIQARVRAELAAGPGYASSQAPTQTPAPKAEKPEKTALRVARANGGFVTPAEVSLEGDLSVDEARQLLEKLAAAGHAEMRVRSSGVVVYFFPEFARDSNNDFAV